LKISRREPQRKMKVTNIRLLLPVMAGLVLSGCARPGPPLPPSLEMPKPVNDLRAVRKGDKVYLRWTVPSQTVDGQSVRSLGITRICRSADPAAKECQMPVTGIPAITGAAGTPGKPSTVEARYTDTLPIETVAAGEAGLFNYAVEVSNADGRNAGLSNKVQISSAPTLSPPPNFTAKATGEGILLTWQAPAVVETSGQYLWRIYRRPRGAGQDVVAGEVPLDSAAQFVDHGIEWGKSYDYRITTVTTVSREGKPEIQIEGDDSQPVQVAAEDVFAPSTPGGLQAVFSGAGQKVFVDLIWAPDTEPDVAGYNVYRREDGGAAVKINTELVKTPAFRDSSVQSGKKYFYSISAMDLRNNQSERSEEASEEVP
jgi:hypothetical protein